MAGAIFRRCSAIGNDRTDRNLTMMSSRSTCWLCVTTNSYFRIAKVSVFWKSVMRLFYQDTFDNIRIIIITILATRFLMEASNFIITVYSYSTKIDILLVRGIITPGIITRILILQNIIWKVEPRWKIVLPRQMYRKHSSSHISYVLFLYCVRSLFHFNFRIF